MGLALFTEATGALLMERRHRAPSLRSVDAEHLLDWVLEAQAKKWTQRAPVPQGIILKEEEREKERKGKKERMTWGDQALMKPGLQLYFRKELLYPELHISRNERCRVIQSQLNIPSVLPLLKPGHILHTFPFTRVLCYVHYLLALWSANIL